MTVGSVTVAFARLTRSAVDGTSVEALLAAFTMIPLSVVKTRLHALYAVSTRGMAVALTARAVQKVPI